MNVAFQIEIEATRVVKHNNEIRLTDFGLDGVVLYNVNFGLFDLTSAYV